MLIKLCDNVIQKMNFCSYFLIIFIGFYKNLIEISSENVLKPTQNDLYMICVGSCRTLYQYKGTSGRVIEISRIILTLFSFSESFT